MSKLEERRGCELRFDVDPADSLVALFSSTLDAIRQSHRIVRRRGATGVKSAGTSSTGGVKNRRR
jgi:hypothetical protein